MKLSHRYRAWLLQGICIGAGAFLLMPLLPARATAVTQGNQALFVSGQVLDAAGKPVGGALVTMRSQGNEAPSQTTSDTTGNFRFDTASAGTCTVRAEGAAALSNAVSVVTSSSAAHQVRLILQPSAADASITFSDQPNFTVAGVTDWTAVGGHGSDATLRTSEDLARATSTLKADAAVGQATGHPADDATEATLRSALAADPQSYNANRSLGEFYLQTARYQQALGPLRAAAVSSHGAPEVEYDLALACRGIGDLREARLHIQTALSREDAADYHRLAGEIDEQGGDPFAAVQHMQRAVALDPAETNFFAWGSELLLHRAVWQAAEIFERGTAAFPQSSRMRTGWGTALFAGARYDEAAQRLCEASDLNPAETEPYLFLGRIDAASPAPLPCVEERLQRFFRLQPGSAAAHYLYAMALSRREGESSRDQVEALLTQAVALDPAYADAFLQLGIRAAARQQYPAAIALYQKAIAANPQQGEAHYRLAVAYDRTGQAAKAREERAVHGAIERARADAVEQERRQVKQFLVVLQKQPAGSPSISVIP